MRKSVIPGHNNQRHLSNDELENNIGGLPVTEPKIRELFDSLDVNEDGALSFTEVKKFYTTFDNFGVVHSDREIEAQMKKYTTRADGKVGFDEFMCMILHIAQR